MTESTDVRVLVVDHKPNLLDAVVDLLRSTPGVTVVAAVRLPTMAVELASQTECDVLLFGFSPLEATSLDSLKVLRARLPGAYIIASSFDTQDARRAEALAAGADEYIQGFRLDEELVPRVLNHERRQRS